MLNTHGNIWFLVLQSSQHYVNSCVIWDNPGLPATRQRRRSSHNTSRSRYLISHPTEGSRLSQPCARRGTANGRGQVRTWTPCVRARKVRGDRLNHSGTANIMRIGISWDFLWGEGNIPINLGSQKDFERTLTVFYNVQNHILLLF